MRRRLIGAGALVALILAVAGAVLRHVRAGRGEGGAPIVAVREAPAAARAPAGTRVRVEVLNATQTRGLARRATQYLRDLGYDVVEVGTTRTTMDRTLVIDRSGHPDWARRVAAALGGARVEARPDSSRYLDVTVLLGAAWRPPAEPFYP